jgi:hypothetical protein
VNPGWNGLNDKLSTVSVTAHLVGGGFSR